MKSNTAKALETQIASFIITHESRILNEFWPEIYNTYKDDIIDLISPYVYEPENPGYNERNSFEYFIEGLKYGFETEYPEEDFPIFADRGILLSRIVGIILSKIGQ
jgi:hypothetical protein